MQKVVEMDILTKGVAISTFTLDAKIVVETEANDANNKTASGELISDHGCCACME